MSRHATGNPTGRQKGSGRLGTIKRVTVHLPEALYTRLEAYAVGRHYHRGAPQLASCLRELLEHALACPYKKQTHNIPVLPRDNNKQRETVPLAPENTSEQSETAPAAVAKPRGRKRPATALPDAPPPAPPPPRRRTRKATAAL